MQITLLTAVIYIIIISQNDGFVKNYVKKTDEKILLFYNGGSEF